MPIAGFIPIPMPMPMPGFIGIPIFGLIGIPGFIPIGIMGVAIPIPGPIAGRMPMPIGGIIPIPGAIPMLLIITGTAGGTIAPAPAIPSPEPEPMAFPILIVEVLVDVLSSLILSVRRRSKSIPMLASGLLFGPAMFKSIKPLFKVSVQTVDFVSNFFSGCGFGFAPE